MAVPPRTLTALLSAVVYDTLVNRWGCAGHGAAFAPLHPDVTDAATLIRRAARVLREGRRLDDSGQNIESLMLDALPYFREAHVDAVRRWWFSRPSPGAVPPPPPVSCGPLGSPLRFRPNAAKAWRCPRGGPSETSVVELRVSEPLCREAVSHPRGSAPATPPPRQLPQPLSSATAPSAGGDELPATSLLVLPRDEPLPRPPSSAGQGELATAPGEAAANDDEEQEEQVPVCVATAWGRYMDADGRLYQSDGAGSVRWVMVADSTTQPRAASLASAVWRETSVRFVFISAEAYRSEVTGNRHMLHRVEALRSLEVPMERFTPALATATLELAKAACRGGDVGGPSRHRTFIGIELDRMEEAGAGGSRHAGPQEAAAAAVIGVFCRREGRISRHGMDPVSAESGRFLFPASFLVGAQDDVVVEIVYCAPSNPDRLRVRLVSEEILLGMGRIG